MNDFFSFLLALLTFGWLRDRKEAEANAASMRLALRPRLPCMYCEDDVYLDDGVFKHCTTLDVMRSTPHGTPHAALPYLPPLGRGDEGWDDENVPVVDNSDWIKR